jgi:steroid delta-isomerase-like uncharacterized protein
VRRFYAELWNQWRFELAAELLAPELEFRGSLGDAVRGRDGFIDYATRVRAAFPDFHNEIQELVVADDRVAARLRYNGTHRGVIFGAAPSGERISYAGAAFFSFDADARILHAWVLGDLLALLRQLGLRVDRRGDLRPSGRSSCAKR